MEGGTTSGVIGRARRHCGAAGEKKRAELWRRMCTGIWEPTQFAEKSDDFSAQCVLKSGVVHQISSHFLAHILHSQFLPSFSMPATPQAQIPVRSGCVELKRSRSGSAGADRRESVVVGA